MINEDAFELIVSNMRETPTNNKKIFAKYILGETLEAFPKSLLDAWHKADGENQQRLAIAFPQIASAMIEYQTLPEKKREKYLRKLLGK